MRSRLTTHLLTLLASLVRSSFSLTEDHMVTIPIEHGNARQLPTDGVDQGDSCVAATAGVNTTHVHLALGQSMSREGQLQAFIVMHASMPSTCLGRCEWHILGIAQASSEDKNGSTISSIKSKTSLPSTRLVPGSNLLHLPESVVHQQLDVYIACHHFEHLPLCHPVPSQLQIHVHRQGIFKTVLPATGEDSATKEHTDTVPAIVPASTPVAEVLVFSPESGSNSSGSTKLNPNSSSSSENLWQNATGTDRDSCINLSGTLLGSVGPTPQQQHQSRTDQCQPSPHAVHDAGSSWAKRFGLVLWLGGVGVARHFALRKYTSVYIFNLT